jgi:hypothetical protein
MHAHCTTTGAVDGELTLQIKDYALYSATWRARSERGMFNQDGPSSVEVLDTDCRFLSGIAVAVFCIFRDKIAARLDPALSHQCGTVRL